MDIKPLIALINEHMVNCDESYEEKKGVAIKAYGRDGDSGWGNRGRLSEQVLFKAGPKGVQEPVLQVEAVAGTKFLRPTRAWFVAGAARERVGLES